MAPSSDQLQAEIAETRARISEGLDRISSGTPRTLSSIAVTVTEQVRKRPFSALVLALLADSLLQAARGDRRSDHPEGTEKRTDNGYGSAVAGSVAQAGTKVRDGIDDAAERLSHAAQQTTSTVADAAVTVVDTASSAAKRVTNSAKGVVEAGSTAAVAVVESAGDAVARTAEQASHGASDVTVSIKSLPETVGSQVQQRPFAAVGLAIGAGALLQPSLAPYVQRVAGSVRQTVGSLGSNISPSLALSNQDELDRLMAALAPATIARVRQFTNRDLRDYLDVRLAELVPQAPVRAALIAAVTERVDALVDARLPNVLERNLNGTRALLAMTLVAAILSARNRLSPEDGQPSGGLAADLVALFTRTSREQLEHYFPEIKDHLATGRAGSNGGIAT